MRGGDLGIVRSRTTKDAFPGGWGRIPDDPLVSALVGALCKGGPGARTLVGGWSPDDRGRVIYRHMAGDGAEIVVSFASEALLVGGDGGQPGRQWSVVENISPLTIDVALVVLAQIFVHHSAGAGHKSQEPCGRVTARAILGYKGLVQWGTKGAALRQRIDAEIRRLHGLSFEIRRTCAGSSTAVQTKTGVLPVAPQSLFHVVGLRTVRSRRKGSTARAETIWTIGLGGWAGTRLEDPDMSGSVMLPQSILRFDHRSNRGGAVLAKKIGLYICFLSGRAKGKTPVRLRIGDLLENIGELPQRHVRGDGWGCRMRERVFRALQLLQQIAVSGSVASRATSPGDATGRTRGWVGSWLNSWIVVDPNRLAEYDPGTAETPVKSRHRAGATPGLLELHRGSVVRTMRVDRKISQCDLARHLGISAAYLSQIENERRMPSQALLRRIARWAIGHCGRGSGRSDKRRVVAMFESAAHRLQDVEEGARQAVGDKLQKVRGPQGPAGKGGCT